MAGQFWKAALLLEMAAAPLAAQDKAPPSIKAVMPPQPVPVKFPDRSLYGKVLVDATKALAEGKADKAVELLETESRSFTFTGPDAMLQHAVVADLITLLAYSDPAKAQMRYDAWVKAAPDPSNQSPLDLLRMPVLSRLHLLHGKAENARAVIAAHSGVRDALVEQYRAKVEADLKAKIRKKNKYYPEDTAFRLAMERFSTSIRLSEFLIEAHERGDVAFADFTPQSRNPFFNNDSTLNLHSSFFLSCASSGLSPQDWMVADIGFDRVKRSMIAIPFAASGTAVIEPMLEALEKVNISISGMRDITERQRVLLRCTRSTPPISAAEAMPDYTYLRTYLLPLVPDPDAEVNFNIFRDPISNLVRDKNWVTLLNYAYSPFTAVPEKFGPAQRALLTALETMPKPDPVAIAIVKIWMLPDSSPGEVWRTRNQLPLYSEAVNQLKDVPSMPPRVRAFHDFRLASMHEIVGDAVAAEAIYRTIVARAPKELEEKSSEVMRARLRLAAITEASGRFAESAELFQARGLSPGQCSLYQSRPVITSFQLPDYPSMALRREVQGNVQFEFDLNETGKPDNFRVLASTPPFVFDKDTIRSFSKASFAPATRGGKALPCEAAIQSFTWRIPD